MVTNKDINKVDSLLNKAVFVMLNNSQDMPSFAEMCVLEFVEYILYALPEQHRLLFLQSLESSIKQYACALEEKETV